MKTQDTGSDETGTERRGTDTSTRGGRRMPGRALRIGLAVVLVCKVAAVALWYTGGLSAALALAAEGSAGRTVPGKAADAPKAGEARAKSATASGTAAASADGDVAQGSAAAAKPPEARACRESPTRRNGPDGRSVESSA